MSRKTKVLRKIASGDTISVGDDVMYPETFTIWKKERKKGIKFVGDNKNFKDAFKFARDNYGPDAIFIWRGKKYNTKHKGEK